MAKICSCLITSPPITQTCPSGNCIYTPNLLVEMADAANTCGEVGIINLSTKINVGLCTQKGLQYSVTLKNKNNRINTMSYSNGQISYTLLSTGDSIGTFEYTVKCGVYSSTGKITIIPFNACYGVVCGDDEICDKCTGCIPAPEIFPGDGEVEFGDLGTIVYNENSVIING